MMLFLWLTGGSCNNSFHLWALFFYLFFFKSECCSYFNINDHFQKKRRRRLTSTHTLLCVFSSSFVLPLPEQPERRICPPSCWRQSSSSASSRSTSSGLLEISSEEEELSKFVPREGQTLSPNERRKTYTFPLFSFFFSFFFFSFSVKLPQSGISPLEWNDTFSPGGFRNNDGTPICEVDRSHLSALPLPGLLCSGGKERYVRELLKLHVRGWLGAVFLCCRAGFSLSAFHKSHRKKKKEITHCSGKKKKPQRNLIQRGRKKNKFLTGSARCDPGSV